ncbi:DUF2461 domain-containing protein [bacterium]|nr:DUF2461 domain-containing protein [bacterium]
MFAATLEFVRELRANNNRQWFQANRPRYEAEVVAPARRFIAEMCPWLAQLSPYLAEGTLFRIHRDVRFSADKSPYKTHVGIHFRHEDGKNAHCPGYYFHLEPGECFGGAGIWRPEKDQMQSIRLAILQRPEAWAEAKRGLELAGESLKRPQKEWVGHPQQEDLMRKDFVALEKFDPTGDPLAFFQDFTRRSSPLLSFLCQQTGHPF